MAEQRLCAPLMFDSLDMCVKGTRMQSAPSCCLLPAANAAGAEGNPVWSALCFMQQPQQPGREKQSVRQMRACTAAAPAAASAGTRSPRQLIMAAVITLHSIRRRTLRRSHPAPSYSPLLHSLPASQCPSHRAIAHGAPRHKLVPLACRGARLGSIIRENG